MDYMLSKAEVNKETNSAIQFLKSMYSRRDSKKVQLSLTKKEDMELV